MQPGTVKVWQPRGRWRTRLVRRICQAVVPPLLRCGSPVLSYIHRIDVHFMYFMHPSYYDRSRSRRVDDKKDKKNPSKGHVSTHSCGTCDVVKTTLSVEMCSQASVELTIEKKRQSPERTKVG